MVIDGRQGRPRRRTAAAFASAAIVGVCSLAAGAGGAPAPGSAPAANTAAAGDHCLPSRDGYLRAHVAGAVDARIDWPDQGTRCEGESKGAPSVGVRLSFQRTADGDSKLLFVFGLTGIREGQPAKEVGANLTLIVQGTDRIYGTLGDSRCTVDALHQKRLGSSKAYRVEARGFCTQPAHAVRGDDAVLVSTFEFAGLVNYEPAPEQDIKSLIPGEMTPVK
jgi:hypothetical protein